MSGGDDDNDADSQHGGEWVLSAEEAGEESDGPGGREEGTALGRGQVGLTRGRFHRILLHELHLLVVRQVGQETSLTKNAHGTNLLLCAVKQVLLCHPIRSSA